MQKEGKKRPFPQAAPPEGKPGEVTQPHVDAETHESWRRDTSSLIGEGAWRQDDQKDVCHMWSASSARWIRDSHIHRNTSTHADRRAETHRYTQT